MTLTIFDIASVGLAGTLSSSSTLDLLHDGQSLTRNGDSLFNELKDNDSAEIVVADFDIGGETHQAHVWEVSGSGALSKWSRAGTQSASGARSAMNNDVIVVAVPPGVSVPEEPAPEGPPAPGTTQKKVRVKVEKQGGLPFP